ncbi:MAG: hypothetical protein ACJ735_05000 [Actinomycetes bacterium]
MTGPAVRPPWTVALRRFWRLGFRSQSPGFKLTAATSAAVLAVGIGTALVGFGSSNSTLHEANGSSPSANGPGSGAGPSSGPGANAGHGKSGGSASGHGKTGGAQGPGAGQGPGANHGPVGCHNPAGATDHGVSADAITVVMPWPNLSGFEAALATASPSNSSEDPRQAINAFSSYINKHGGINCRKLNVLTPEYDPGNEDGSMRPLCVNYTKDHPVFAWIDGVGAWHDSQQLCVAQEGHTPLISSWTTTGDQLSAGAPNLWWTGPDLCNVLRNLVHWSVASGKLTKSTRFGVVYSTNDTDVRGYHNCLLPALAREGLHPTDTGQLQYSTTGPGQSAAQAPGIATKFKVQDRITTVIPMLPFFQFESWLSASVSQQYYPKLMLSDYDQQFQVALGLVGESGSGNTAFPSSDEKALQDQEGPTYYVLGNNDGPPWASPLGQFCDDAWHASYKPAPDKPHIESTGTAMTTCENLELFATAAAMAGNNLTRARFNAAMSRLTNFNGGTVPNLRFGGRSVGPHLQRIVSVHNNHDNACPKKHNQKQGTYNQGNCWLIKSGWSEERLA